MDILCFSTTDWDEIWGSRQQIMTRLATAGHRVLFVERQVGPEQLLRDSDLRLRKLAGWRRPRLRQAGENLWLWQPPLLPPGRYYFQSLNALGQHLLARAVQPVLHQLAFDRPVLWLYPPQSFPLLGHFGERLSVYHCIERFAGEQHGLKRRRMLAQEQALLGAADLVFVHSAGLLELYKSYTRRPILLVPSAADVAHFQGTAEIHPLIAALPHPRIGVAGTIDARLDLEMLTQLAIAHPSWHLALVGQVRSSRVDLGHLLRLPNVHHFGKQRFADLPAFLNGLDVALVPYVLNELTRFISPIKVYEYLAVGKPVVSTDLPEVQPLADWVWIVPDDGSNPQKRAAAFAEMVERALYEPNPEQCRTQRRLAAQAHSWDRRVEMMWAEVSKLAGGGS